MKIRKKAKSAKSIIIAPPQKMVKTQYDKMVERRNNGFARCVHSRTKRYQSVIKRWPWIDEKAWLAGHYRDHIVNGKRVKGRPHTLRTLN